MRNYNRVIPEYADIMTVTEWKEAVNDGMFISYDGIGYWAKDGMECITEEVFSSKPEDATHVAWYNK